MVHRLERFSPTVRRRELLAAHPEYCTVTDVAKALGCTKANVRHRAKGIKHVVIDGMTLYDRASVTRCASLYSKDFSRVNRMGVVGINVERLQRICEVYYRTQYDAAPPELLKLAKRLAGIP